MEGAIGPYCLTKDLNGITQLVTGNLIGNHSVIELSKTAFLASFSDHETLVPEFVDALFDGLI